MNSNKNQYDSLNEMMSIIIDSTKDIADIVFKEYRSHPEHQNQKKIYNLFADAFIGLSSFCKLMFDKSWSQAAIILRSLIEEVATLYILSYHQDLIEKYINLDEEYCNYVKFDLEKQKDYNKSNRIKNANDYFNYSWFSEYTKDKSYGRDQLLELAKFDEFIIDIKETLNLFAHGRITIFQFCNDDEKWELMSRYGRRIILIACKLFDYLCCSFKNYIGDSFYTLDLNSKFIKFKSLYLSIIGK